MMPKNRYTSLVDMARQIWVKSGGTDTDPVITLIDDYAAVSGGSSDIIPVNANYLYYMINGYTQINSGGTNDAANNWDTQIAQFDGTKRDYWNSFYNGIRYDYPDYGMFFSGVRVVRNGAPGNSIQHYDSYLRFDFT